MSVEVLVGDSLEGLKRLGVVADQLGREAVLIELNPDYARLARTRMAEQGAA